MRRKGPLSKGVFLVEMGQAFKEELPAVLRTLGGRVSRVTLDETSTLVLVRVSFGPLVGKKLTAENIQAMLFDAIPGPSIRVVKV